MPDTELKISPIPYTYKWGGNTMIEFWVKYSPKKSNATAGFISMVKEKFVGFTKDTMPIIISEKVDKQVRPLIVPNRWMYFVVVK
jgi:hypothetical protein